jgi:hypothetical protein
MPAGQFWEVSYVLLGVLIAGAGGVATWWSP